MPCRIYLRRDQSLSQRTIYACDKVTVFAPSWVKEALNILGEHLNGVTFELYDNKCFTSIEGQNKPAETFTITKGFNQQSLKILQKIARNESSNVSGVIQKSLYSDIKDKRILYSIRDLVRQSIIVGVDACSRCGGYCCDEEVQNLERVYICDLAALQFQQPYNSGRLVLIQEDEPYKGILDDIIFENVVGEKKLTFEDVSSLLRSGTVGNSGDVKKRYLSHDGYGSPCFIDTKAYAAFVKLDVILSGIGICKMVHSHHPTDKVLYKFLKYGTGFFAWKFSAVLDRLILPAVIDGLEELFEKPEVLDVIKYVELPFYKCNPQSSKRIEQLRAKYGIKTYFGTNDALKQSPNDGVYVATTNCGDNHAVCGNEMGFSSVDAAIAENLESKGNIFSPNLNLLMSEQYLEI